jgi:hypothetical protein
MVCNWRAATIIIAMIWKERPNIVTSGTQTGRLLPTKHQGLGCSSQSLGCVH